MVCFFFSFLSKRSDSAVAVVEGDDDDNIKHIVKTYTYKQLKSATDGFAASNKLGQGGFSCVYKGQLKDGTAIAVKLLSSESKQGERQFLNELGLISNLVHENLVKLHGCCVENGQRMLVYEYAENNSIAQTLLGGSASGLDWGKRARICIGIARGLEFLHETVTPHVVHRDIKASNILLDKNFDPKISDFGLARLKPLDMTHVSTRVAGTIGYLAPEYAILGQLTRRADVYSFGVLLLEIVTVKCNTEMPLPTVDDFHFLHRRPADIIQGHLLMQTLMLYECGNLSAIVDSLEGEINTEEACRFLKIGLLCTQDAPKRRPHMPTVVKMLTGDKKVIMENITKPALIADFMQLKIRRQKEEEIKSSSSNSSLSSSSLLQT